MPKKIIRPALKKAQRKALPQRLTLGRYVLGPDFHGCINTGMAPAMLKSTVLHKHPSLARGFQFAVGPQIQVEPAVRDLVFGKIPDGQSYHQPPKLGRHHRVRFFKTYASARKHFQSLVQAAEEQNAKVRAEEQTLRRRAATGDIGAAMELIDY